jgi:hypothetical protein
MYFKFKAMKKAINNILKGYKNNYEIISMT